MSKPEREDFWPTQAELDAADRFYKAQAELEEKHPDFQGVTFRLPRRLP